MSGAADIRQRILLFEPMASIGADLEAFLVRAGFEVERVTDVDLAVQRAHERWYRVLILGVETAREPASLDTLPIFLERFPKDIPKILQADIAEFLHRHVSRIEKVLRRLHHAEIIELAEYDDVLKQLAACQQESPFNDRLLFDAQSFARNPIHRLMGDLEQPIPSDLYGSIHSELEDLFRRSYDCDAIRFEQVMWNLSGQIAVQIRSIQQNAAGDRSIAILDKLTLGPANLNGRDMASLPMVIRQVNLQQTTHYRLRSYILEGDPDWSQLRSIRSLIEAGRLDAVEKSLRRILDFVIGHWQKSHSQPVHTPDLSQSICGMLQLGQTREITASFKAAISNFKRALSQNGIDMEQRGSSLHFQFDHSQVDIPDPQVLLLPFLRQKFAGIMVQMPCQVDFDRTFVDTGVEDGRVWVTHLDGRGSVPRFWPEVALEFSVREHFRGNLDEILELESCLCTPELISDVQAIRGPDQRLGAIIQRLRPVQILKSENARRDYQLLVAYKALAEFIKLDLQADASWARVVRAYDLLVILALTLQNFARLKWIDQQPIRDGRIEYDAGRDLFSVDGKEFGLPDNRGKFLLFFMESPAIYHTYADVGRHLFPHMSADHPRSPLGSLRNQIQQIKHRVTEQLEQLSPGRVYFESHPGRGYIFHNPPKTEVRTRKKR